MDFITPIAAWCGGPGFWHGSQGWFGGAGFHFGSIFQLIIIGLIIYFTARLFRKHTATSSGPASAEDILKQRYAAGEIDEQTYRSMKQDLQ